MSHARTLRTRSYAGRWFQVYADLETSLFESNFCVVVRARLRPPAAGASQPPHAPLTLTPRAHVRSLQTDYGLFANNTISVRNRQRDKSVTGAFNGILGYAVQNNITGLGKSDGSLSVYLQLPAPAPQGIPAPYDIILLGPATYGPYGLYQYAVVSDPLEVGFAPAPTGPRLKKRRQAPSRHPPPPSLLRRRCRCSCSPATWTRISASTTRP